MCIRDRTPTRELALQINRAALDYGKGMRNLRTAALVGGSSVSYTHLRAHETVLDLVCRLLLEKKKRNNRGEREAANTY